MPHPIFLKTRSYSQDETTQMFDDALAAAKAECRKKEAECRAADIHVEEFDPEQHWTKRQTLRGLPTKGGKVPTNTARSWCEEVTAELEQQLVAHRTKIANAKIASAAVARHQAAIRAAAPPKSKKEIASELWDAYQLQDGPVAKRKFYELHRIAMD